MIKLLSGVVQGIKNLEKQANEFCESKEVHSVTTCIAGAQVIISVVYSEQPMPVMMNTDCKPLVTSAKKKVSKAKAK